MTHHCPPSNDRQAPLPARPLSHAALAHTVCGALILASQTVQVAVRDYLNAPNASHIMQLEQALELLELATLKAIPPSTNKFAPR